VALMNRVLKGQALAALDVLVPLAVCVAIAAVCIAYVARQLRAAALR
jgi:sodium transport system permease protein